MQRRSGHENYHYDIDSWWPFGRIQAVSKLSGNATLVVTDTGHFIVKTKDAAQVSREENILRHLNGKGVSTHKLLHTEQFMDGAVVCVYSYLEGAAPENVLSCGRGLGIAIAELQEALSDLNDANVPIRSLYDTIYGWVLESTSTCDDRKIRDVEYLLNELRPQMHVLRELPRQIIHRDAHPGNMIFDQGQFVGFVDFDIVENNIRLFDPCYCAASALPTEFNKKEFPSDWLAFTRDIFGGYERLIPLSGAERGAIPYILIGIEALFTALFIKSAPEVARQNASICLWLADMREEIQHHL